MRGKEEYKVGERERGERRREKGRKETKNK